MLAFAKSKPSTHDDCQGSTKLEWLYIDDIFKTIPNYANSASALNAFTRSFLKNGMRREQSTLLYSFQRQTSSEILLPQHRSPTHGNKEHQQLSANTKQPKYLWLPLALQSAFRCQFFLTTPNNITARRLNQERGIIILLLYTVSLFSN